MVFLDKLSVLALSTAAMLSISVLPTTSQDLALPERRALSQFQEARLPKLVGEIHAAAGFEVPVEIRWAEVAVRGEGQYYNDDEYWVAIFFKPLTDALKAVGTDKMGKDALKSKLKGIVYRYEEATAPASNYPTGVTFQNGILTVNFRPRAGVSDVEPRAKAIQSALESGL